MNKITNQLQKLKSKVQDIDVEKITQEGQKFRDKTTEQVAQTLPRLDYNTIKADVENYIRNSFCWHFNHILINDEFQEVIYDSQANPTTTRKELEETNQEYFGNLLKQRCDISEASIKEISEQMQSDRQKVLEIVKQAQA